MESCCWGLASGDVAPWIKRWADGEITQGSGYSLLSFEVMAHGSLPIICSVYYIDGTSTCHRVPFSTVPCHASTFPWLSILAPA